MKKFYIIFVIFVLCSNVFGFENVVVPNSQGTFHSSQNAISNGEIETLEKQILKKVFNADSPLKRISRLEKEVFGMEQKGDIQERYENLLTASDYYKDGYRTNNKISEESKPQYYTYDYSPKNYNQTNLPENSIKQNFNNYDFDYYIPQKTSQQKQSKVKQFFTDLAEALSAGVVTGYTTPVYYDIDPFAPNFIGYPQTPNYVNTPQTTRIHSYHNPYIPRTTTYSVPYNNFYMPPSTYNNYYAPRRTYYRPYGPSSTTYGSGTRVKIIN